MAVVTTCGENHIVIGRRWAEGIAQPATVYLLTNKNCRLIRAKPCLQIEHSIGRQQTSRSHCCCRSTVNEHAAKVVTGFVHLRIENKSTSVFGHVQTIFICTL